MKGSFGIRAPLAIILLLTLTALPVIAAPDGATTTLEITEGASALYYTGQAVAANKHSKGARAEAEKSYLDAHMFADPKYKVIDGISRAADTNKDDKTSPPLTLEALRNYILDTVKNDEELKLTSVPSPLPMDAAHSRYIRRNNFEILRGCWNEYTTTTTTSGDVKSADNGNGADDGKGGDKTKKKKKDENRGGGGSDKGGGSNKGSAAMRVSYASYTRGALAQSIPQETASPVASSSPGNAAKESPSASTTPPPPQNVPQNALGGDKLDCLQPIIAPANKFPPAAFVDHTDLGLADIMGFDVVDTAAAFANAPSLAQQILNQQVGGNSTENHERAAVLAVLAVEFLDLYPNKSPYHPVEIVAGDGTVLFSPLNAVSLGTDANGTPTDIASQLTTFGTSCLFGSPSISSCQSTLSSLQQQAVAGISAADACAFERRSFIPSYSRIAVPQPSPSPSYGQPPGC